jgi:hypothetical protein
VYHTQRTLALGNKHKTLFGKPEKEISETRKWDVEIKTDLKVTGYGDVCWIKVVLNRIQQMVCLLVSPEQK